MSPPTQFLSPVAAVDTAFLFIIGVSVLLFLGISAAMVFFVIRYRRSRNPEPTWTSEGNLPLELAWTIIPTVIVMAMFWFGWSSYLALRNVPEDALKVRVIARMWSWSFEYENGTTSDRLYVPAGRPVLVDLVSEDVIHSFYIPAFRVKRDAVPGMANHAWFVAPGPGSYDIFCAEYCGVGHSSMITTVEAVPPEKFEEWLAEADEKKKAAEAVSGEELLARKGCTGCHSLDGTPRVGPTLKGIFGRTVVVVTDGAERSVTADEDYIRRSLLAPQTDVVKGFPPVMPPQGENLKEEEIEEIVEYLRGLE